METEPLKNILARPQFQLRSLPIATRWEVTRRNPYYFTCWRHAQAEHRNEPVRILGENLFRKAAVIILGQIGVSGEPPDPAITFAELGEAELQRGWLSGAAHPVTMRGLAMILLAALPQDAIEELGMLFLQAGLPDVEGKEPNKAQSMMRLTTSKYSGLDDFFDEPIVSINPAASERSINEAIDLLLNEWKRQRKILEQRIRSDKFAEYFEVWDLREGWSNGVYDRTAELTFKEIAEKTKREISTLNNQYCRAFELIVGHPYSREGWLQCFGTIKLSDIIGSGRARTRRPTAKPTARDVPDSVVSPSRANKKGGDPPSVVGNVIGDNDGAFHSLLDDIARLIHLGRNDEQIADELELPKKAVVYLRKRGDLSFLRD
jgi:hypothetical protein